MKTTAGALSLLLEFSIGWLSITTKSKAKGQNNHGVFVFWLWIFKWHQASICNPYEWETMLALIPCIEIPIVTFRAEPPMKTTAGALSLLLEFPIGWLTITTKSKAKGQNNHGVFVFWLWIFKWHQASICNPYDIICANEDHFFLQWETMLTMIPCIEIPIVTFRAEPPYENNRGGFVFASWIFNRLAHHNYKVQSQGPEQPRGLCLLALKIQETSCFPRDFHNLCLGTINETKPNWHRFCPRNEEAQRQGHKRWPLLR